MSFQTQQIHAGQRADPGTNAIAVPIFASTAFSFNDEQHVEDLISGKKTGFVYSRMSNPTNSVFETRMSALEGGVAAVSAATGQAAALLVILALARAGDNFVVSTHLFGGTYQQWKVFLPRLGITAKFVSSQDPADFERAIDENTKGIFIESISNPLLEVLDIPEISKVAKKHQVPLIVDNTVGGGGYLIRPIELGADVVLHSATKWISGHGSAMGGVAISSGKFVFAGNKRFPEFNEELPGFPGMILAQKGLLALVVKMRVQTLRDLGCALSPFASFQLLQGLETLSLRMEKHVSNTLELAQWLEARPEVAWVSYPGLQSHASFEVAKRLLPKGCGGILGFGIKPSDNKSGAELGKAFIDATNLPYHAANLGDVRTLIIHPASTTQRQLSPREQELNGTAQDLVRVSVGIEDIKDIIADFKQALEAVAPTTKRDASSAD